MTLQSAAGSLGHYHQQPLVPLITFLGWLPCKCKGLRTHNINQSINQSILVLSRRFARLSGARGVLLSRNVSIPYLLRQFGGSKVGRGEQRGRGIR